MFWLKLQTQKSPITNCMDTLNCGFDIPKRGYFSQLERFSIWCLMYFFQTIPFSGGLVRLLSSVPPDWPSELLGEYAEEGSHNGKPYLKQRNTEGKTDHYIYFSGQRWRISGVLGDKNGRGVFITENVRMAFWKLLRIRLKDSLCQLDGGHFMLVNLLLYVFATTFLAPPFAFRHYWCIPVV